MTRQSYILIYSTLYRKVNIMKVFISTENYTFQFELELINLIPLIPIISEVLDLIKKIM